MAKYYLILLITAIITLPGEYTYCAGNISLQEQKSIPAAIAYRTRPIITTDSVIYLSQNNTLVSLTKDTMRTQWESNVFHGISEPLQPIEVKGSIITVTNDGHIYCINKKNGLLEKIKQLESGKYFINNPVYDDASDIIYLFSNSGLSMIKVHSDKVSTATITGPPPISKP